MFLSQINKNEFKNLNLAKGGKKIERIGFSDEKFVDENFVGINID